MKLFVRSSHFAAAVPNKVLCVAFVLSFLFASSIAQTKKSSEPDTTCLARLVQTAANFVDPDSSITQYNIALPIAIESHRTPLALQIIFSIGERYKQKSSYSLAKEYMIKAFAYSTSALDTANCYKHVGGVCFNMGDYVAATDNYLIALQYIHSSNKPTAMEAAIYLNLGNINFRLKQYPAAIAYFNKAEALARKNTYLPQLGLILVSKAEYYTALHRPDTAIAYFKELCDIGKKVNHAEYRAFGLEEVGMAQLDAGHYENAINSLQEAIAMSVGKYRYIEIDAGYSLGKALYKVGRYKEAEHILLHALDEAAEGKMKDNVEAGYETLAAVYKATNQYEKAAGALDNIIMLRDSVDGAEKAKTITQLEFKYQTAEKDKRIAMNELLIERQENMLAQKNTLIVSAAFGVLFLLIASLTYYRHTRYKERLHAEQILSLEQQNTISILQGTAQGEEKERGRIARELHDGIGGMLSAAMMRFMTLRHHNKDITSSPAYIEAMNILDQMGDEIRKTAHNLMPEVLLKQNLAEAIESFCQHMQKEGSLKISFQSYGPLDNIIPDVKLNIYRIVQELLKNIARHANATQALVQLVVHEHVLTITVEDNGGGFDSSKSNSGIGLFNVQTRVRRIGGQYTLETEPGKGTSVYIELDLQNVIEKEIA